MTAALAIAIFVVVYALIATERIHRVAAALGGAALMVVIGATDADAAFFSHETGIDWTVIFLLLGMMVIVGVIKETGLFEYLAIWSARRAGARPFRVMLMLVVITAVASAALDNVTTVLLIAPVTMLMCDRLGIPVIPFLIAEALASNIGGTATLIGDPPNIIIASRADLSFNDFLINLGPLVVVLLLVFMVMCRFMFRSAFTYDPERAAEVMALNERDAISDPKLLIQSLVVLALVLTGFILHTALDVEPAMVAMLGAGLLIAISRITTEGALREVEWPTLAFFMGLFIMVGGLIETGVIDEIAQAAGDAIGGELFLGSVVLVIGSGVLSAIVDNIPYVTTMSPVVADLVEQAPEGSDGSVLWWALALGADLGGNATAIGASANVVILGIAERNGYKITFWGFTKYGALVAALTIALAIPYLWLRYFAFA